MLLEVVCAILVGWAGAALPSSLRYPLPMAINRITSAHLTCDGSSVNATVTLQHPFKGLLFAKDFSHECNAIGTLSNVVSLTLPTSGCGVRLSSRPGPNNTPQMVYTIVLVIQQDRHLRQIVDQEKYFECQVPDDAFLIKSSSLLAQAALNTNHRQSRKFDNQFEMQEGLEAARAWMEITPLKSDRPADGTLQVGEAALLTVKLTLPPGIGWKVVDCSAQDGLGDSSQKLLDDDGCPIDENILPVPEFGPVQPIKMMKHQEAVAQFDAFKFPDRDRLHITCRLELCRGNCQMIDCTSHNETSDNRLGRTLTKGDQGEILDKLEVFNSVEVLAPSIDEFNNYDNDHRSSRDPIPHHFKHLPGDRSFCVSPDKIAITFCILGVIFLCAVIIAACALLKSRRTNVNGPFYTRSLFSSSSGGSAYGSKLLLHESPCLGQSTSSRTALSYGRIL